MTIKYAFISDIHGNSPALQAVLDDIAGQGIEEIYNLGDSLFGPLDPHGTFQLLSERRIKSLAGNGDRELLAPDDGSSTTMNRLRQSLTKAERQWLADLPAILETDDFLMFHGSPDSDVTYFLENLDESGVSLKTPAELKKALKGVTAPAVVCGHSHQPGIVQIPDGPLIVNAGSVGLPAYFDDLPFPHKMETRSPQAKYAVLEKSAMG